MMTTVGGQVGERPVSRRPRSIVTPAMINLLWATHGWALFMAVVSWIMAGLIVIASIVLGVVSFFVDDGRVMRLIAWPYLALGIVQMVPSLLLSRYASALRRLRAQKSEPPLLDALHHERRLWKFAAIAILTLLGIAVAGVATAVLIPTTLARFR